MTCETEGIGKYGQRHARAAQATADKGSTEGNRYFAALWQRDDATRLAPLEARHSRGAIYARLRSDASSLTKLGMNFHQNFLSTKLKGMPALFSIFRHQIHVSHMISNLICLDPPLFVLLYCVTAHRTKNVQMPLDIEAVRGWGAIALGTLWTSRDVTDPLICEIDSIQTNSTTNFLQIF